MNSTGNGIKGDRQIKFDMLLTHVFHGLGSTVLGESPKLFRSVILNEQKNRDIYG